MDTSSTFSQNYDDVVNQNKLLKLDVINERSCDSSESIAVHTPENFNNPHDIDTVDQINYTNNEHSPTAAFSDMIPTATIHRDTSDEIMIKKVRILSEMEAIAKSSNGCIKFDVSNGIHTPLSQLESELNFKKNMLRTTQNTTMMVDGFYAVIGGIETITANTKDVTNVDLTGWNTKLRYNHEGITEAIGELTEEYIDDSVFSPLPKLMYYLALSAAAVAKDNWELDNVKEIVKMQKRKEKMKDEEIVRLKAQLGVKSSRIVPTYSETSKINRINKGNATAVNIRESYNKRKNAKHMESIDNISLSDTDSDESDNESLVSIKPRARSMSRKSVKSIFNRKK